MNEQQRLISELFFWVFTILIIMTLCTNFILNNFIKTLQIFLALESMALFVLVMFALEEIK